MGRHHHVAWTANAHCAWGAGRVRARSHPKADCRGRERAKARGVKLGRRPKLTDYQRREAITRRDSGDETLADIARSYNVSHSTISRLAQEPSERHTNG